MPSCIILTSGKSPMGTDLSPSLHMDAEGLSIA